MSKLCLSVSATKPNSTLCKLQSRVDILEVGVPDRKKVQTGLIDLSLNQLKAYISISRSANALNVSI